MLIAWISRFCCILGLSTLILQFCWVNFYPLMRLNPLDTAIFGEDIDEVDVYMSILVKLIPIPRFDVDIFAVKILMKVVLISRYQRCGKI